MYFHDKEQLKKDHKTMPSECTGGHVRRTTQKSQAQEHQKKEFTRQGRQLSTGEMKRINNKKIMWKRYVNTYK